MKELELLKKDWKAKESSFPKLNKEALYALIWKRSSSIVKWLYYISIAEFVFWTTLSILTRSAEQEKIIESMRLSNFITVLTAVNYSVLVYFIVLFYYNYKLVSYQSSVKELIQSILKVKKTVSQYVWFNLSMLTVGTLGGLIGGILYGPESETILEMSHQKENPLLFWGIIGLVVLVVIALAIGLLLLFYRLLYGILLKKLKHNYKELIKLEN